MTIEEARQLAAQLWCLPEHTTKTLDNTLAESIAHLILHTYHDTRVAMLKEVEDVVMKVLPGKL